MGATPVKGATNLGSQASAIASAERQLGRPLMVTPKAQSGGEAVDLTPRQIPALVAHVWDWFHEMAGRRTSGVAANPISYQDVMAWAQLTDRDPTPWEVHLLLRLDDTMLASLRG